MKETERGDAWHAVKQNIAMVRSIHPFEPRDTAASAALELFTMYGTSEAEIDDLPTMCALHTHKCLIFPETRG